MLTILRRRDLVADSPLQGSQSSSSGGIVSMVMVIDVITRQLVWLISWRFHSLCRLVVHLHCQRRIPCLCLQYSLYRNAMRKISYSMTLLSVRTLTNVIHQNARMQYSNS